jgi:hypothetical protein
MSILTGIQKREIHKALQSCFTSSGAVKLFLAFNCDKNLNDIYPENSKLPELLFEVLDWFDRNGRLAVLVNALITEFPDKVDVQRACENVRRLLQRAEQLQGNTDPFEAVLLVGARPFVNRRQLRDNLRALASRVSQRVGGVSGSAGSGKSYSLQYIAHVIQQTEAGQVISVEETLDTCKFVQPEDLAARIFLQIGKGALISSMPRKANTNPGRWVVELRDWIVGELNQTELAKEGKIWWLVADGICSQDVPKTTRELVQHLCKSAHVNVPCLRVILLDSTEEFFPADILSAVANEQIAPIGRPEVQEYFENLASSGYLRIDAEGIKVAVNKVFSISPNGSLRKLAETVRAVSKALAPGGGQP